jgi:uncharacterized protein (DUF3084 family)
VVGLLAQQSASEEVIREITGDIVAILAGIGAIVSATLGVALAVRGLRDKGRKTALAEADASQLNIEELRREVENCRRELYEAHIKMADHGIDR